MKNSVICVLTTAEAHGAAKYTPRKKGRFGLKKIDKPTDLKPTDIKMLF